jgi:hypothetical protein
MRWGRRRSGGETEFEVEFEVRLEIELEFHYKLKLKLTTNSNSNCTNHSLWIKNKIKKLEFEFHQSQPLDLK